MGDKRYMHNTAPTLEARFFRTNEEYQNYCSVAQKSVTPLKSWDVQLLQSRALRSLHEILEYYHLTKFVSFSEKCYPRLVRMFYANLGVMAGKVSCYVMNKKLVLDLQTLADLFELDASAPCKLAKDFEDFSRAEALKLLFPNQELTKPSGKILISKLSVEDRLLHFTIVKCLTPRSSNTTNIIEDELFLMWAFKKRLPLNIPFIILHYMGIFFKQDLSFYPYGMPLTKVFKRFKVPCSLEKEIAPNDPTTLISEGTLHLMKLRLVEGAWIKTDDGGTFLAGEGSSSSATPSNEVLTLLRNLHLKQDQHFKSLKDYLKERTQELETKIESLDVKVDGEFTQIHNRLNSFSSQLNHIEEQLNPEEL